MTRKKHKFVGGTTQPSGDLEIRIMRSMDLVMYEAAKELRDKAWTARKASETATKERDSQRNAQAMADEFHNAWQSTLLAALALEAHINRFAIEKFKWEWFRQYDEKRPSLEEKWSEIPLEVTGQSFDKGKEPFQSLHRVKELRDYIVHSKPRFDEPVNWRGTRVAEQTAKLNLEAAQLACRTFEEMTRELETFVKASESDSTP